MPRGRKPNKTAAAQKLLDALAFVRVAQPTTNDVPYKNHCAMWNNWLLAFDGVLAAGHPIDEDLACCPHTEKLHHAIARSTKTLTIAETTNGSLSIKADKFNAIVPCLPFEEMVPIIPDPPCGDLTDRIRAGFNLIGGLAKDNSEHIITSSVLVRNGSMVTTDRKMVLEYWHGLNLPTFVIPKAFITAIGKIDKEIISFGFTENSLTVYFLDGCWVKTQLYNEEWPNVDEILNGYIAEMNDIPKDFFEGLLAVEPFGNGHVYIDGSYIKSHADNDIGATFDCVTSVKQQFSFSSRSLEFLSKRITKIGFVNGNKPVACFFGDNMRGVLMGGTVTPPMQRISEPTGSDDEIPF